MAEQTKTEPVRCRDVGCRQKLKIEEKNGRKVAALKTRHHGEIHITDFTKEELLEVIKQL